MRVYTTTPTRRATLLGTAALASVAATGSAKASSISPALQQAFDEWQRLRDISVTNDKALDAAYRLHDSLLGECPKEILRQSIRASGSDLSMWNSLFVLTPMPNHKFESERITSVGLREELASYDRVVGGDSNYRRKIMELLPIAEAYEARIEACREAAGFPQVKDASDEAFDAAFDGFLRFLRVRPRSLADVHLQAKHVADWVEGHEEDAPQPVPTWFETLAQGDVV